jgi:hypothetical protein
MKITFDNVVCNIVNNKNKWHIILQSKNKKHIKHFKNFYSLKFFFQEEDNSDNTQFGRLFCFLNGCHAKYCLSLDDCIKLRKFASIKKPSDLYNFNEVSV